MDVKGQDTEVKVQMSKMKSELLHVLEERGFIYQATDLEALDALVQRKSITGYIGFDATAKSLQVGNLSALMVLRWMQKLGHRPIALIGGGTSQIGDPSFRKTERPLMTLEQVQENIDGISRAFRRVLKVGDGPTDTIVLNNADWLLELGYIDFLRDYGKHFTVNRMLTFETIKQRLDKEEPLSFLEFNYMLLQAYDFYYLHKHYDCVLQLGGSDQWGNIVNGVELTRKLSQNAVFGLTSPLVTNAAGQKLGKSVDGAVWLNPDMRSPYEYWQFWRNTDDRDVGQLLRRFTELPLEEIRKLEALQGEELNEAKIILADEATALLHGRETLERIHATVSSLFSGAGADLSSLPEFALSSSQLPLSLDDFVVLTRLCESKGEVKRLIAGGGLKVGGEKATDPKMEITSDSFQDGTLILSVGKKTFLKVVLKA